MLFVAQYFSFQLQKQKKMDKGLVKIIIYLDMVKMMNLVHQRNQTIIKNLRGYFLMKEIFLLILSFVYFRKNKNWRIRDSNKKDQSALNQNNKENLKSSEIL